MQFTLKLSGYDVSSRFYGAKFLRVLINTLAGAIFANDQDRVFVLQVNFYKVLYNLFENK